VIRQPVEQWPFWQVMPLAQAKADPQPPQLSGSFAKLAHAALHSV
jgi:hypothetical protein